MHTIEVMQICTCSPKKNDKNRHFIDKNNTKPRKKTNKALFCEVNTSKIDL